MQEEKGQTRERTRTSKEVAVEVELRGQKSWAKEGEGDRRRRSDNREAMSVVGKDDDIVEKQRERGGDDGETMVGDAGRAK